MTIKVLVNGQPSRGCGNGQSVSSPARQLKFFGGTMNSNKRWFVRVFINNSPDGFHYFETREAADIFFESLTTAACESKLSVHATRPTEIREGAIGEGRDDLQHWEDRQRLKKAA